MQEKSSNIRRAGTSDLAGLLELYAILHDEDSAPANGETSAAFKAMLVHPGLDIFIAFDGPHAVSTATLAVIPNLTRGAKPYAMIENVVTHPHWRKQSYGRRIINHAVKAAWEAGCYKVMLLSGRLEPATLRFYEGCGFIQNKTGFQIRRPE